MPSLTRHEVDKSLGRAGKYVWVADEDQYDEYTHHTRTNDDFSTRNKNIDKNAHSPFYISEARVVPKPMRGNMYD